MKKYDLIFSLGGNCSAANNIQRRGLRPFACPFDWVYLREESTLEYFAKAVKTRFSDLMLKENLVEITPDNPEWVESHKGFLKYLDRKSGYRFVNHFRQDVEAEGEYERVHSALRRRIDRLFRTFETKESFLLVLGTEVAVSDEALVSVQKALQEEFPGKRFDLCALLFCSDSQKDEELREGLFVHRITRAMNTYDCERTNFEWRFLDEVKSAIKPRRSRIAFHLLPHLRIEVNWKKT